MKKTNSTPNIHWLRHIKPLWLREKIFWKLKFYLNNKKFAYLFENSPLEMVKNISLNLVQTDISHKQIAFLGFTELMVSRCIHKIAKNGGLLVDVGANYGYYSSIWAAANDQNKVVAFEASPRNISALKFNLINNGIESRVDVNNVAVGKEAGSLLFSLGPNGQTGWGGLLIHHKTDAIEVPVVSLDEFFRKKKLICINVLKIDTEGADTWVLQGAVKLLQQHKVNHIFFEENLERMSALGIKPREAQYLLQDCGYHLKKLGKTEWYASI